MTHMFCSALISILTALQAGAPTPPPAADWTIMVYMNAKNDLEPHGIGDFLEMAKVGSSDRVNILTQFGRPEKTRYDNRYQAWTGVKRYRILKGMEPTPDAAEVTLPDTSPEVDMGSSASLIGFVNWSRQRYPARRYMLIIWNHGQGWRLEFGKAAADPAQEPGAVIGGYRSVSRDTDTGHILYNRQIQDGLREILQGDKLDVIGFDACLMAMVETAYAMRDVAHIMVASEELEPGTGWSYDSWLAAVSKKPDADGREISTLAVDSYRAHYGDFYETTLSGIDLSGIPALAQSVSDLSRLLSAGSDGARVARESRSRIKSYGDGKTQPNYVDLGLFLDGVIAGDPKGGFGTAAGKVRAQLDRVVFANYRSKRLVNGFGSYGLSIFYPPTKDAYVLDGDSVGYSRANTKWPVQFVQDHHWTCFLSMTILGAKGCP